MVDAVTGEQIKGYAVGKDQYVIVEDDELANIALESTRTVDIEKFVPKVRIPTMVVTPDFKLSDLCAAQRYVAGRCLGVPPQRFKSFCIAEPMQKLRWVERGTNVC